MKKKGPKESPTFLSQAEEQERGANTEGSGQEQPVSWEDNSGSGVLEAQGRK